ncbi:minor tail protein [Rhodococcus phage Reynauld]|uniref:Minor tail protein n=1 Tax=Rhodococcus phage Reynauld TaxID=3062845 RepID=A0ACD4UJ58_9CAUD|nr:minor tail protein [Rhodococcus phage Reynauld]
MATQADLLRYCTVTYQAVATTDDGPDPDKLPDPIEVSGNIFFETTLRKGGIKFIDAAPPFELFPQRRTVKVINGQLNHNGTGEVTLEAASPFGNPVDWKWKVTYDLVTPSGRLVVDPFYIDPVPGAHIDLTTVAPVDGTPPTQIIRGPQGISIARVVLKGADTFEFYGNDADGKLISSVQIPALTYTAQAQAARDEAIAAKGTSVDAAAVSVAASEITVQARDTTLQYRTDAQTARTGAETARTDAQTARTQAQTAKTDAETARGQAQTHATNAGTSATNAAGSATTASTKAGEASTSATNAAGSATAANTAKGQAETARDAAQLAQQKAEQARDVALTGNVNDGAVTTVKLANDAVTTVKILNANVTLAKLAANSVDSSKIVDASIQTGDLADGAVTSAKILDGTIVNADISPTAAIAKTKLEQDAQDRLALAGTAVQTYAGLTKVVEWYGTQAEYDALAPAVRNAVGFRAAIL